MKVVLADRVLADLRAITNHVTADNPAAARRLVARVLLRTRQLARMRRSGRTIPERAHADVRELIEGSYRIAYVLAGRRAVVVAIFESHRLAPVLRLSPRSEDDV